MLEVRTGAFKLIADPSKLLVDFWGEGLLKGLGGVRLGANDGVTKVEIAPLLSCPLFISIYPVVGYVGTLSTKRG